MNSSSPLPARRRERPKAIHITDLAGRVMMRVPVQRLKSEPFHVGERVAHKHRDETGEVAEYYEGSDEWVGVRLDATGVVVARDPKNLKRVE